MLQDKQSFGGVRDYLVLSTAYLASKCGTGVRFCIREGRTSPGTVILGFSLKICSPPQLNTGVGISRWSSGACVIMKVSTVTLIKAPHLHDSKGPAAAVLLDQPHLNNKVGTGGGGQSKQPHKFSEPCLNPSLDPHPEPHPNPTASSHGLQWGRALKSHF